MTRSHSVTLSGDYQRITKVNKHYIKNEVYFTEFLTPELLSQVKLHLPNLSDFQLEDDRAIFITPVLVGKPLLELTDLTSSSKVDLLNSFLKIISGFSDLPLFMQMNLVRAENFYMVDGILMHRGILIIEDVDFRYPLTQGHLVRAISKFALELIDKDVNLFNFKNYFRNLPNYGYAKSIDSIIDDVREVYINDLFVEETLVPNEEVQVTTNKVKYMNLRLVSVAAIFIILFTTASFAMVKAVNLKESQTITALFRVEQRDDNYLLLDESYSPSDYTISNWNWTVYEGTHLIQEGNLRNFNLVLPKEGTYRIVLKVKDTAGSWSQPYERTIQHRTIQKATDDLDSFNFQLAVFDDTKFKNGTRSIKIDSKNSGFYIENIYLENSVTVDFYATTEQTAPVLAVIEGYAGGKLVSSKSQSISLNAGQWKKTSISFNSEAIDRLEIHFEHVSDFFWLDTFTIHSQK